MSTTYNLACHTCKEQFIMHHYTLESVIETMGEWSFTHLGHEVTMLHDITGWEEEYDNLYFKVWKYKEVDFLKEDD